MLNGALQAQFWRAGATLARLRFHGVDMIVGPREPDNPVRLGSYAGAIVGPVANRVRLGQARVGDSVYGMPRNEDGKTSLHSGPDGLHARDWTLAEHSATGVAFTLTLPDGACGLPGVRDFTVRYDLSESTLRLTIEVKSSRDTIMAPAHHPYWTLGSRSGILNHRLQILADRVLPLAVDKIPSGLVSSVAYGEYDYRRPRPPLRRLDHNFCIADAQRPLPAAVARLTDPNSGNSLEILTTEPGLQVYAGGGLPDLRFEDCFGGPMGAHAGIALEPQGWPNAANTPHFPPVFLAARQCYKQITEYRLSPQMAVK